MNVMPITELIDKVTEICKANGVKRLDLFGSFATGTATDAAGLAAAPAADGKPAGS